MTRCIIGLSSMSDIPEGEWERIFGFENENKLLGKGNLNEKGEIFIPRVDFGTQIVDGETGKVTHNSTDRKKHKKAPVETIAQRVCRQIAQESAAHMGYTVINKTKGRK